MGRKPCCSKEGLSRGAWSAREDQILKDYITTHGKGKWRDLPKRAGLKRCGKSCRLRWLNYLRPDINRGNISSGEEELILRLHRLLGNRWSLIAGRLPGRTDNEIKNYWNTYLSKKTTITSSPRVARKETKKKVVDIDAAVVEAKDDVVLQQQQQQPDHQVIRTKAVRCTKAYIPASDHNSAAPIADKNSSEPAASTTDDQVRSTPPFLDIPLGFDVEEFMAGIEGCVDGGFDQACGYEEEWRGILLDQPQLDVVASALLDSEEECCENDDDPMAMGDASGPSSVN